MNCKRNVKPEMAELKGKRLIIASELEEGTRLNTGMVKQLCSVDAIEAEKKYKDPFHFDPSHMLVLYTNHLPKVTANDDGTWRRLIVIPFNAKIKGKSDIKNFSDYLFENAGPAILSWIIEGAETAIKRGSKSKNLRQLWTRFVLTVRTMTGWGSLSKNAARLANLLPKNPAIYISNTVSCVFRMGSTFAVPLIFTEVLKKPGFKNSGEIRDV